MFVIVILLIICSLRQSVVNGWIVQLDSHTEDCFFEVVEKENKVGLTFQVFDGGFLDIDVSIKSPGGRQIYSGVRETSGKYAFSAEKDGNYQVCFSNKMSTLTPKWIMFDLLVGKATYLVTSESSKNQTGYEQEKVALNLKSMASELKNALKGVRYEQDYMLIRSNLHRRVSEHTNTLILYWTGFELTIALVGILFQIWYIKRCFEIRRII